MIVAKTKMKKIPESCNKCSLARIEYSHWNDTQRYCWITKKDCPMEKSEHGNWKYTRPDWCPLMEVET